MSPLRKIAFWGGLCLVLVSLNGLIMQKERLIARGERVFLPLAPRDPRSLMQGDYMVLRYDVPISVEAEVREGARTGTVVLRLDERGVGTMVRLHGKEPLAPNERLLAYKRRGRLRFGAESFFFQEGHGRYWDRARFAELRLDGTGKSLLVTLRGPKLEKIVLPDAPSS